MLAADFPTDGKVFKQGNLCVRYFGDAPSSRFLTGPKKGERKMRYVEFVRSTGKYYLLVHKIKKDIAVPYFKIEIDADSVLKTMDKFPEFRFCVDNEDVAVFDHEDSIIRNEWVEILNGAVTSLNAKVGSPAGVPPRNHSAERNGSPVYARTAIDIDARLLTPGIEVNQSLHDGPSSSAAPLRSRGALFSSSSVGLTEPVRKIQKHIDGVSLIGSSGRSTPEPMTDHEELPPVPPSWNESSAQRFDVPPFSLSPNVQRVKRVVTSPGTGIGIGPGTGNAAESPPRVGGNTISPPRIPAVRAGHGPDASSAAELPPPAISSALVVPAARDLVHPETELSEQDDTHNVSVGVLLHETQALSAMNDELNEALERTESLLRATEEDHSYQMAHLRALLERAQVEPDQLREKLSAALEDNERMSLTFNSHSEEVDRLQSEISGLMAEKTAAEALILELQDTVTEYELKYSVRNVDRIKELELALAAATKSLAERENEVEELSNQLDAYRAMIREKEEEIRSEPMQARSLEMSTKRTEMQQEIDNLRKQLDRKDQEFINELGGTFASQVKAKMVPLSLNTKKLTMDLATAQASEESQRASRVHLENVIAQQEGFIEQLEQKILTLKAEATRNAELSQEIVLHKDDARSAAQQRELAHKERDEALRRVAMLERELAVQRDVTQTQLEAAQEEIFKYRAHANKVGLEDSHLHAEMAILQRRVDLGKEQYLQLENQLHEAQRQHVLETQHHTKKKEALQESLDAAQQTVRELQHQVQSVEEVLAAEQLDARRRLHEHEEMVNSLKRTNKEVAGKVSALEEKAHKLELSLTSERMNAAHVKEQNETLEYKVQSAAVKYTETVEELEQNIAKHQKSLAEVRQQLRDSEAQRRAVSEREGSTQRDVAQSLKAAEDANRALREEIVSLNQERQNELRATEERIAAQVALQEKIERKNFELERLLSTHESERRVSDQQHATREAALVTANTDLATQRDLLEASLQKEKSESARLVRSLEEAQAELRAKTQLHEKVAKLHQEQLAVNDALTQDLAQAKRAHAALVHAHAQELDSLHLQISTLQLTGDESDHVLNSRIQSLEDALLSTSRELKQTSEQLHVTRGQLTEATNAKLAVAAQLAELQTESQIVANQLDSQTQEASALTQRVAELTHTRSTQNDRIAELQEQVRTLQVETTQNTHKLEASKVHLQSTEDELRDVLRRLETAEDRVHYLQDIAIPDLNNSAMETVEKYKSEQNRFNAEIEALQRSIEQRERAAKELHTRIHELEGTESNLNQSYSTLSLKMGEMIPIKDYNHRLEQQRQANAVEIAELSTSKLNAIAERDEAVSKMAQVLQECRREAYTLRRLASNIAIHADTDIRPRSSNTADPVTSALAATTNKPVADIFNAAEETGTELREMVALVSTFSESLLRDFVSLRTSAVHQWFALQAEINKGIDAASPAVPVSQQSSPTKDTTHGAIPTASLQELLQQNESMLGKLVSREKSTTLRLSRQFEEMCAQKLQCEARIADLLVRIESLDAQLIDVQSSRQSTEHRCATEVNALQQRISQLMADLDRRQDEYSEMVSGLTRSHEDQLQRQAHHLAAVSEQRLAEINLKAKLRSEELEQRLRSTETALKTELDEAQREYKTLVELHQRLELEASHRNSEANAFNAKLDTLQAELHDRTAQLENSLNQLERAELKAAKEARQRLELERTLRRFKNPSLMSSGGPGASSRLEAQESDLVSEQGSVRTHQSLHGHVNHMSHGGVDGGRSSATSVSSAYRATTSGAFLQRDRTAFDRSYDGHASVNNTSMAVEDLNETTDRLSHSFSHAPRGVSTTPLHRSALLRAATPESSSLLLFSQREPAQYGQSRAHTAAASNGNHQPYHQSHQPSTPSADTRVQPLTSRSLSALSGPSGVRGADHLDVSRRYTGSVTSTIQSAYSSPDFSPEPAPASRGLLTYAASQQAESSNSVAAAQAASAGAQSAFDRAFLATSRIEQAMKAKGWKLNK